jgi:hypothetical protein
VDQIVLRHRIRQDASRRAVVASTRMGHETVCLVFGDLPVCEQLIDSADGRRRS